MESKYSELCLNFFGLEEAIFSGYKFLGNVHNFNETNITINKETFKEEKSRQIVDFELISKSNIKNNIIYKFFVYKGLNKAYCFLDGKYKATYDVVCLDKSYKIFYMETELKEMNTLENDPRMRLILINFQGDLKVNNDLKICLKNYLSFDVFQTSDSFSYQLSVFDFEKKAVVGKISTNIKNEFSVVKNLEENRINLENFFKDINILINDQKYDHGDYENIFRNSNIKKILINFSQPNSALKSEFSNNDLYRLLYIYMLWYTLDIYYYSKKSIKKIPFLTMYKYITNFYNKYLNDKELLPYQRAILFCSNVIYFTNINDISIYESLELEYIKLEKADNNSVFGLSTKFINDFVNNLNSNSYLFYPLLLLDSGIYDHFKYGNIYGFDFQSCETLKEHLRELIPDVLFLYNKKDLLENDRGFNFKGLKVIFLNKSVLLNGYKGIPISENFNEDIDINMNKHYAMRITKVIIHECFGHNKFIFKREEKKEKLSSPEQFYNKKKCFIKMIKKSAKNAIIFNSEKYFLTNSMNSNPGESGNFLEYFFGKYENDLIIDLLLKCKNIGKLIDNASYFTKEDLEILKKYIIDKYIISEKSIKYEEKQTTSLEDDIKEMDLFIKKNGIKITEEPKEKPKIDFQKSMDEYGAFSFLEDIEEQEEKKNYDYYAKKILESKSNEESREYALELIMNHLKV